MKTKLKEHRDSNGKKIAAEVVIHRASEMTTKGRNRIVNWLRREADFLEKNSGRMASRFTATWRYGE